MLPIQHGPLRNKIRVESWEQSQADIRVFFYVGDVKAQIAD